ncbi:MAG: hypothetical protein M1817_006276 [Caeruleum heppii]|nr:MAG: hypothetical protein M1817_006276 [Caeruleum heppii]
MVVLSTDPARVQYLFSRIDENITGSFLAAVISTTALATIAMFLRYLSRVLTKAPFGWDDHTIVLALVTAWGMLASNIFQVKHGAGKHLVAVVAADLANYVKGTWALELAYFTTIFITKISILLLYRRIFTLRQRGFRIAFWAILVYSTVVWFISFFCALFQCMPVNYNWDRTIPGYCLNVYLFTIVSSVMNILADVLILVMPLPLIWKLYASRANKIVLSFVFLLGSFVCIASIVRFPFLLNIPIDDFTFSNDGAARWSTVEANIAIVSACLPSLRPLYGHLTTRFGSSARSKQTGSNERPWFSDPNGIGSSSVGGGDAPGLGMSKLSSSSTTGLSHHKRSGSTDWSDADKSDVRLNGADAMPAGKEDRFAWMSMKAPSRMHAKNDSGVGSDAYV